VQTSSLSLGLFHLRRLLSSLISDLLHLSLSSWPPARGGL
jgi:hypothetical protein